MTKPKPGAFKAACQVAGHEHRFETTDAALFEAHMLEAHGAKPGMCAKRQLLKGREGPIDGFTSLRLRPQLRLGKGLWNGPRLTEEGSAFEATGLQLGATVRWRELLVQADGTREWVERSGQVWCAGWRPRSAWVVPFERLVNESAVMVEQRSSGELEHYSTQQSSRAA